MLWVQRKFKYSFKSLGNSKIGKKKMSIVLFYGRFLKKSGEFLFFSKIIMTFSAWIWQFDSEKGRQETWGEAMGRHATKVPCPNRWHCVHMHAQTSRLPVRTFRWVDLLDTVVWSQSMCPSGEDGSGLEVKKVTKCYWHKTHDRKIDLMENSRAIRSMFSAHSFYNNK